MIIDQSEMNLANAFTYCRIPPIIPSTQASALSCRDWASEVLDDEIVTLRDLDEFQTTAEYKVLQPLGCASDAESQTKRGRNSSSALSDDFSKRRKIDDSALQNIIPPVCLNDHNALF